MDGVIEQARGRGNVSISSLSRLQAIHVDEIRISQFDFVSN